MEAFLKKQNGVIRIGIMTVAVYMTTSLLSNYRALFFTDAGLTTGQIGIINAVTPVTTLIFQNMWGHFADRTSRRLTLVISLTAAGLLAPLYLVSNAFGWLMAVCLVSNLFMMALETMVDAVGIDYCTRNRRRYGPLRMCGTIGFALTPWIIGTAFNDSLRLLFPVFSGMCVLSLLTLTVIPKEEKQHSEPKEGKHATDRSVLKDPVVLFILCCMFSLNIGTNVLGYFPILEKSLGMSTFLIGVIGSIGTFTEIPMLLLIDRFVKRFSYEKMILFGIGCSVFRLLLVFTGARVSVLQMPFFVLQMLMQSCTFINCYYCCAGMIHARFPEGRKASAQTVLALVQRGLAAIVGSLIGGFVSDWLGIPVMMASVACLQCLLLAGLVFFYRYLRIRKLTTSEWMTES